MSASEKRPLDKLCVDLMKPSWRRRGNSDFDEGGLLVSLTWRDGTTETREFQYEKKWDEKYREPRQIRHTQTERVTTIAGWIADIVAEYDITGWIVGNGSLCHYSDSAAEAAGLKVNSLKWRRKQVYSICLEEVNSYGDAKPCGKPIYEAGIDLCSLHSKRSAKETQERDQQRAARVAAEMEKQLREAEMERCHAIIDEAVIAATAKAGLPYPLKNERYGSRKGKIAHVPVDTGYHSTIDASRNAYVPIDVLLKMCEAITGTPYTLELPQAEEPKVEEPQASDTIASPFG